MTMDQFRTDLRRLFAEVDRSDRETDEFLLRLETRKRALVKKDMRTSIIHKTVASDKTRGLEFVLSDATPDRYNDIILTSGWELENFKKIQSHYFLTLEASRWGRGKTLELKITHYAEILY
jgi:hypothetical protein